MRTDRWLRLCLAKIKYRMKITTVYLLFFAMMFSILSSCEVSTARLTDPRVCTSLTQDLCSNDMPEISVQADSLVASCKLKNAPPDTKVKFTWMYYGETKITIDDVTFDSGNEGTNLNLNSTLSRPANGWPKGVYEVEMKILIENKKPLIKQFTIK
jgi:hypothetical protein